MAPRSRARAPVRRLCWLAVLVVIGAQCWFGGSRSGADDKLAQARQELLYYADHAYPAWRAAHPGQICPRRLRELPPPPRARHLLDPWGSPYLMACAVWSHDGRPVAVVRSAGPDRRLGTHDDLDLAQLVHERATSAR